MKVCAHETIQKIPISHCGIVSGDSADRNGDAQTRGQMGTGLAFPASRGTFK